MCFPSPSSLLPSTKPSILSSGIPFTISITILATVRFAALQETLNSLLPAMYGEDSVNLYIVIDPVSNTETMNAVVSNMDGHVMLWHHGLCVIMYHLNHASYVTCRHHIMSCHVNVM